VKSTDPCMQYIASTFATRHTDNIWFIIILNKLSSFLLETYFADS